MGGLKDELGRGRDEAARLRSVRPQPLAPREELTRFGWSSANLADV